MLYLKVISRYILYLIVRRSQLRRGFSIVWFQIYLWQENPPAWTQEAHHPPRSKCLLCWLGGGGFTPSSLGWRVPPVPGLGGYPIQSWMGEVPQGAPCLDLGWGTPLRPDLRWGTPPASVDRHTDSCQNITLPRTSYASGKNYWETFRSWIFSQRKADLDNV